MDRFSVNFYKWLFESVVEIIGFYASLIFQVAI